MNEGGRDEKSYFIGDKFKTYIFQGGSVNISHGYRFKKKILNQSQKNFGLKKDKFLGHPNSGSCV